jgi:hypothetical protein
MGEERHDRGNEAAEKAAAELLQGGGLASRAE